MVAFLQSYNAITIQHCHSSWYAYMYAVLQVSVGGAQVDGVHPLIFEDGRRPPTDRVVAGWTVDGGSPASTHSFSRRVDAVPLLLFFHLHPSPWS